MTAYGDAQTKRQVLEDGAKALLTKADRLQDALQRDRHARLKRAA